MNETYVPVQRIVKVGIRGDPFVAAGETLGSIVDHGRVERAPIFIDALRSKQNREKTKLTRKQINGEKKN